MVRPFPLLLNLLEVCAYFTAPPIALLGVYSFWHGSLPEVLQWMAQAGACCMLAMTSCLPLLRLSGLPDRRRLLELLVILLVMLVVWASMVSNAQDLPIPRPVLFFP
jgi:hypothetical protein